MRAVAPMRVIVAVGAFLAVGVVAAVVVIGSGEREATVYAVVDGDTVDIAIGEGIERVRLRGVDAPETGDPPGCLAAEATEHLLALLPRGSVVTLDDVQPDRFGRTHAVLRTDGGVVVNAEMARAGLVRVTGTDGDERLVNQVREAAQAAQDARVGLHSDVCDAPVPVPARNVAAVAPTTTAPPPDDEPERPAPQVRDADTPTDDVRTPSDPGPADTTDGSSDDSHPSGSSDDSGSSDEGGSSDGGGSSDDDSDRDQDSGSGNSGSNNSGSNNSDNDSDDGDRDDDDRNGSGSSDEWDELRDWWRDTFGRTSQRHSAAAERWGHVDTERSSAAHRSAPFAVHRFGG